MKKKSWTTEEIVEDTELVKGFIWFEEAEVEEQFDKFIEKLQIELDNHREIRGIDKGYCFEIIDRLAKEFKEAGE